MKPDFIKVRDLCSQKLMEQFEIIKNSNLGFMANSPRYTVHEGETHGFLRPTGKDDSSALKQLSAGDSLDIMKLNSGDTTEVLKFINTIAVSYADQMKTQMFDAISEVCDKNGNSVNANNLSLEDMILEMYNRIQVDFNQDGSPKMPQLILGEGHFEKLNELLNSSGSELKRKIDKILYNKKQDWLERENNRKLVD